jgi:V/A-type H+/Na+-transporting ATPase subunit I
MPSREARGPVSMRRVAVVAPTRRWRNVLAAVADCGVLEPDVAPPMPGSDRRSSVPGSTAGADTPRLASEPPDIDALRAAGRGDLLAGEADLERVTIGAVRRDEITALAGWAPAGAIEPLSEMLAPRGGSVVVLPNPSGVDVPTAFPRRPSSDAMRPLVDTYATVPYRDVDPLWFAAIAYVVMFGMMFGDVGDGLLLIVGALLLRRTRGPRFAGLRRVWSMVLALGAAAAVFGLLYGEAFGPTGIVPTLWLAPLDQPEQLLLAGIGVGAVLIACAYVIGIVNRWRESGPGGAIWASNGIAGATLFVGLGLVVGGVVWSVPALWGSGLATALVGLVLAAVGLRSQAGPGAAGVMQAGVETFDVTMRLGSNVVSFARLAAFGLMHAAIGFVVWDAAKSLWGSGPAAAVAAVAVFMVGHAVAFALEALVAGVQALRLEYYELFSRIFVSEGRPFRPWHIPFVREETPC